MTVDLALIGMSKGEIAKTATFFERGDAEGQTIVYCQQVFAGAKLAASLQIKACLKDEARRVIAQQGCKCRMSIIDGWVHFWIYKHPFVELLLDEIEKRGVPKSAFDTWVNGKLFGYSDYEIAKVLEAENHI